MIASEYQPEVVIAGSESEYLYPTANKTLFYYHEAQKGYREDKRETYQMFYKRLNKYNMGHFGLKWHDVDELRTIARLELFDCIASQLDMPSWLQKEWRYRILNFDLRQFKRQSEKGMGEVICAFCLCAYACWTNGWKTHPEHSEQHPELVSLQEQIGISQDEFRKGYGRVQNACR